ncbi:Na/Pi cotransporter family protein [Tropicibacter sp. S64]|uniref:Na/Pi cotransporter family protein n=1 Tax=Tropicibacter sp. S64 TaxID=3415122 RepID=UPI003C7EC21A
MHLFAAVALLLWAVRLVRTGVERAFLGEVSRGLRRLSRHHPTAVLGGLLAAMLMQSGTAVTLIASGFIAGGAIAPGAALMLIIGAELGSAVMARVLFLPIQAAVPVLLLVGVGLNFRSGRQTLQQAGRILVGLALMLLALGMIREATAPIAGNEIVRAIAAYLSGDLLSAFALGAVLAWSMHSSLAAVLTVASLAATGVTPWPVAAALVLGANLGGAVIPMTLLAGAARAVRAVTTANLIARGSLALAGLAVLAWGGLPVPAMDSGAMAITLHVLFNAALVLCALPLSTRLPRLGEKVLRPEPEMAEESLSALDPDALSDPRLGLACARRELMRMGETVQAMLLLVKPLYRQWDAQTGARIRRFEDSVDRMHFESKLYISRLRAGTLSDDQSRQTLELVTVANGLEEAADRIAVNLLAIAQKMQRQAVRFSDEGLADLETLHDVVCANAQLAMGVLTTGSADDARQLVAQKDKMRGLEQTLQERHLQRLQDRGSDSVASTNMHQEILRLLKQVNTSLSYAAYPILEEAGAFLSTRLARSAAPGE